MTTNGNTSLATLGGGCFWCIEAVFSEVQGIIEIVSGYSGGKFVNPSYEQVCSGTTGHAEVVQITFDPNVVSFNEILEIFFAIHDPTQLNRQGNDVGPHYRSVIFFHSNDQRDEAAYTIKVLGGKKDRKGKIVTELTPFEIFYPAKDYHQNYFKNNPTQSYCSFVISPKLSKFRQMFGHKKYFLK